MKFAVLITRLLSRAPAADEGYRRDGRLIFFKAYCQVTSEGEIRHR